MVRRTALAALLLLVLLAIAVTRGYDASGLGEAALAEARDATGLSLEADATRFRPLEGLELHGVHAASRFPGGDYDVTLREIRLEHRLGPLLQGRLDVDRLVLTEPRIVLTLGVEPKEAPEPPPPRRSAPPNEASPREEALDPAPPAPERLRLHLSEILVEDASFAIRDRSEAPERLGIEGLGLDLDAVRFDRSALTLLHGIAGEGTLVMGALRFARTEVRSVEARVAAEGGRYALSELSFETAGAVFEDSGLELDFNSIPFRYRLDLAGRGQLPGILGGGASLRLEAKGFGTSSRGLSGEGVLELATGALPDAPWVRSLEAASGAELVGRAYGKSRLEFRVDANELTLEGARIELAPIVIEAEGTVDLEGPGPIDVALSVHDGPGPALRFRLKGTFAAPELEAEE